MKRKSTTEILRDYWFMENQMKAVLRDFGLEPFRVLGYFDPPDSGFEVSYIERKNNVTKFVPIRIPLSHEEGLLLDASVRNKLGKVILVTPDNIKVWQVYHKENER